MNPHLRNYLRSFRLGKEHVYTLLLDGFFLGLIGLGWFLFGNVLEKKAWLISQGKSTEQLKQMLMSMDPGQAEAFLVNIKSFVFSFLGGLVLVVVGSLLVYSLSRKLIWGHLLGQKGWKKRYWRWNLLNLVLVVLVLLYLFIWGIVRLVMEYLVSWFNNQVVSSGVYALVSLVFLLGLVGLVFLVYYSFARKYKVWESIGEGFSLVRLRWRRVWRMFLFVLGTGVVLSLGLWPVGEWLRYRPEILGWVNIGVSLVFLMWMRIYVFKTVRE